MFRAGGEEAGEAGVGEKRDEIEGGRPADGGRVARAASAASVLSHSSRSTASTRSARR
jgi:hypothetical protein